jgi:hypothetical protein
MICEEIDDLCCANCIFSGEGSDDEYRSCRITREVLESMVEYRSGHFCGEGMWMVRVNKEDQYYKTPEGLADAITTISNGGINPWAIY